MSYVYYTCMSSVLIGTVCVCVCPSVSLGAVLANKRVHITHSKYKSRENYFQKINLVRFVIDRQHSKRQREMLQYSCSM